MNPRGVVSRQRGMEGLWPQQGGPWSKTQEDSATLRIPYLPETGREEPPQPEG